jgi:hypothetical protein
MKPILRRLWSCCLMPALWLAVPSSLPAAEVAPAEELLRFVPQDVTMCLVVRDLRGHCAALADSPFAQAVRRSPLGLFLQAAPELRDVFKTDDFLAKHLKITLEQLRDDVLGDAVVFAYRADPLGKPERDEGMLLVRARQPQTLATLVERLNAAQKKSGDLKSIEERTHNGVKYFRRVERKETNFYYLRGPVLVFSAQESLLRRAIAQERSAGANQESPLGKQLRLLGADRALTALLLNPRGLDAVLEAKLAQAKGADAAFLKTFVECWKGLENLAFTFSLSADLELGLTLRAKPGAMPPAVRRFFDETATRSDLWARFPDNALLALAARTKATALVEMLAAFQTREVAQALRDNLNRGLGAYLGGKDALTEVLPFVGPDWGLCVSAPPASDKRWAPRVIFAVRVGTGDKNAPVDQAILGAVHFLAQAAIINHNRIRKEPLSLKTLREGKWEIRYLSSSRGQVSGFQPAFGLWDGYLVLASSPEAFRRFAATPPVVRSSGEVPLLRLSLKDLRQYLQERRESLTAALAEQHQLPPKEVRRRLVSLIAVLHFFDRVELVQRTSANQATLTLRLRTSAPLRK